MTLTAEQLETRRKWVGGSDAPAILGVDPWRTAADVWHEKVYGVDGKTNDAMDAGSLLEPSVLAWAQRELGPLIDFGRQMTTDDGLLGCTLDAVRLDDGAVVQVKTTGICGPGEPDAWGEPGTDQVPERVIVQTHHEMVVCGAALAWVPVLIGGRGFVMYRVDRNRELAKAVADAGRRFMVENVAKRVAPTDSVVALETLQRLRREPDKRVTVPVEVYARYTAAQQAVKSVDADFVAAKTALLEAMGDAEIGECALGEVRMQTVKRRAYTVEETTYKQLRVKEAK